MFKFDNPNEPTELQLEAEGSPSGDLKSAWSEFTEKLPQNDSRYGVFKLDYTLDDGAQRSKVILVVWYFNFNFFFNFRKIKSHSFSFI